MIQTVAVDFDGVLHTYDKGWHDGSIYGELLPGAVDALDAFRQQGRAVYVFTSRDPFAVAAWLTGRGVDARAVPHGSFFSELDYILVTNRKLPAIAYIDDRAVHFLNWHQAMIEMTIRYPVALGTQVRQ